jgi:uncharacterized membrane protein
MIAVFGFAIGVMAGLRSLMPLAVVAWAVYLGRLDLHDSYLSLLGSAPVRYLFSAAAIGELIGDKVPSAPNRTAPIGLATRVVTGAISAAALGSAWNQSVVLAALVGAAGGVIGAFAGFMVRRQLVKKAGMPDFVVAILEDAIAILGSVLIVSR